MKSKRQYPLASKLPEYFQDALEKGEKVTWFGQPTKKAYVKHVYIFLVVGILWFLMSLGIGLLNAMKDATWERWILLAFFSCGIMVGSLLNLIRVFYLKMWEKVYYVLSNKRIMLSSGLFHNKTRTIYYDDIYDVLIKSTDKNRGTILIDTGSSDGDGNKSYTELLDFENPEKIYRRIRAYVNHLEEPKYKK